MPARVPPQAIFQAGPVTQEQCIWRRDSLMLDTLGVDWIGLTDAGPGYHTMRCPPHLHVRACLGGRGLVWIDDTWLPFLPGQVLIAPANQWHGVKCESEHRMQSVAAVFHAPERLDLQVDAQVRLQAGDGQPLALLVQAILQEHRGAQDPSVLALMLQTAASMVGRLLKVDQGRQRRLFTLWRRISAQLERDWSFASLAAEAGMSQGTLWRCCIEEYGRSPVEQLAHLRMVHAAALWAQNPALSIQEAALRVGYNSPFAFSRAFKKWSGLAPKDYRDRAEIEAVRKPQTAWMHHQVRRWPADANLRRSAVRALLELPYPDTPPAAATAWRPLRLDSLTTRGLTAPEPSWFGECPLEHFAAGAQVLHGIPFEVPGREPGSLQAIVLASGRNARAADGSPLPNRVVVPVGGRVRALYFLHACAYANEVAEIGQYAVIFADPRETPSEIRLRAPAKGAPAPPEANIQDWWPDQTPLANRQALPVPVTHGGEPELYERYLYTLEWTNPRPELEVAAIELQGLDHPRTTLAVLAITVRVD